MPNLEGPPKSKETEESSSYDKNEIINNLTRRELDPADIPEELKSDKGFMKKAIDANFDAIKEAPDSLQKESIEESVKNAEEVINNFENPENTAVLLGDLASSVAEFDEERADEIFQDAKDAVEKLKDYGPGGMAGAAIAITSESEEEAKERAKHVYNLEARCKVLPSIISNLAEAGRVEDAKDLAKENEDLIEEFNGDKYNLYRKLGESVAEFDKEEGVQLLEKAAQDIYEKVENSPSYSRQEDFISVISSLAEVDKDKASEFLEKANDELSSVEYGHSIDQEGPLVAKLASVAGKVGDVEEGLRTRDLASKHEKRIASTNLTASLANEGYLEEAEKLLEDDDLHNEDSLIDFAFALADKGEIDRALEIGENVDFYSEEDKNEFMVNIAQSMIDNGELERAEEIITEDMLNADSSNGVDEETLYDLADSLAEAGRIRQSGEVLALIRENDILKSSGDRQKGKDIPTLTKIAKSAHEKGRELERNDAFAHAAESVREALRAEYLKEMADGWKENIFNLVSTLIETGKLEDAKNVISNLPNGTKLKARALKKFANSFSDTIES